MKNVLGVTTFPISSPVDQMGTILWEQKIIEEGELKQASEKPQSMQKLWQTKIQMQKSDGKFEPNNETGEQK